MSVHCNNCGMCCKLIPLQIEGNISVRDGFQIIEDDFFENLTLLSDEEARNINENYVKKVHEIFPNVRFYSCKCLENNICKKGHDKPLFCNKYPSSPVAIVPDECGCLGEIFIKNEELKRKIRMIKEEMLDYQALIDSGDKDAKSYAKIIENLSRFIRKYVDFGANDW